MIGRIGYSNRSVKVLVVTLVVASLVIGVLGAALIRSETVKRDVQERLEVLSGDLAGPRGEISARSKRQIAALLGRTPHVLGASVSRNIYGKKQMPIIHWYAKHPVVEEMVVLYEQHQTSGQGESSDDLRLMPEHLRNSEESLTGFIKCGNIEQTNVPSFAPNAAKVIKGACRAVLPPFRSNANLSITIFTDLDGLTDSDELQEIQQTLLQLQIDIYNRDYRGRETWPEIRSVGLEDQLR